MESEKNGGERIRRGGRKDLKAFKRNKSNHARMIESLLHPHTIEEKMVLAL